MIKRLVGIAALVILFTLIANLISLITNLSYERSAIATLIGYVSVLMYDSLANSKK